MSSTATAIAMEHFNKIKEQRFNRYLCDKFNIKRVMKPAYPISKEACMEKFLLGAVFTSDIIYGMECDLMIYKDTLYILGQGELT